MVSAKHSCVLWQEEQGVGELWDLKKKKKERKPSKPSCPNHKQNVVGLEGGRYTVG